MMHTFDAFVSFVGTVLIHGSWIGLVVVASGYVGVRILRSAGQLSAATTHAIWMATLLLVVASYMTTAWVVGAGPVPIADALLEAPDVTVQSPTNIVTPSTVRSDEILPSATPPAVTVWNVGQTGSWILISVVSLWLMVSLVFVVRLVAAIVSVARMRRRGDELSHDGEALGLHRSSRLIVVDDLTSPAASGPFSPAILLPASIHGHLSAEELRPVLLHEAAHLERYDDVALIIQRFVGCFLWFHPAVRWLEQQLEHERELAADDWAVQRSGEPIAYVRSIARLLSVRLGADRHAPVLAGLAVNRNGLLFRMKRVIEHGVEGVQGFSRDQVLVAGGLVALVAVLIFKLAPLPSFGLDEGNRPWSGDNIEVVPAPVADLPPLPELAPLPELPPLPALAGLRALHRMNAPQQLTDTITPKSDDPVVLSRAGWIRVLASIERLPGRNKVEAIQATLPRLPADDAVEEAFVRTVLTVSSKRDRVDLLESSLGSTHQQDVIRTLLKDQ